MTTEMSPAAPREVTTYYHCWLTVVIHALWMGHKAGQSWLVPLAAGRLPVAAAAAAVAAVAVGAAAAINELYCFLQERQCIGIVGSLIRLAAGNHHHSAVLLH